MAGAHAPGRAWNILAPKGMCSFTSACEHLQSAQSVCRADEETPYRIPGMAEAREEAGHGDLDDPCPFAICSLTLNERLLGAEQTNGMENSANNPSISRYYRLVALVPALVRYLIICDLISLRVPVSGFACMREIIRKWHPCTSPPANAQHIISDVKSNVGLGAVTDPCECSSAWRSLSGFFSFLHVHIQAFTGLWGPTVALRRV